MGQAFISYSRRDKDKVYAICDILTDAGFPHWIDKNDIRPTEQWRAEIVEGIKNSDSFILFISPASISSPNVVAEVNIASEQEHKGKLKIVPVLLIPTELTDQVEYQLSGIQRVDLSQNFTAGLENLLSALGNLTLPKGYKKHLLSYLPGTYITPSVISPLPNPSQEVVVGKTINIKQIRDQRFMPRPKVLVNALQELDLCIKEQGKSKDDEIFTFWIHGRSGSGKSVLLLQLLQHIVLQRNAQAFWFYSDENEKLYDFFEKWAEQGFDLNEPLFVFTDDFNTPSARDLAESKSISSLLRNPSYSNVNWPVIITCSPPEYLEDFRNGGKDEGFRIKEWEIPTIDAEESKQLIQWFETRTGKKSKTGKAFEQSDGLALSMLFELWYYAQYRDIADKNEDVMKAFGQRFKTRLEALNLTDAIAPILALNRLYIWPPNSWLEELTPDKRDAFKILVDDKDFSILSIEPSPSGFVRLTHPHLSDVIYQAIRPKNANRITRAHDLAFSFEKALKTNILIAHQILRIVSEKINNEQDRLASDEIDIDELAKLFTKTWIEQNAIGNDNKGLLTYIWINWAIWNFKNPKISNYLNEANIVEKSLHCLDNQHKLWGELWLILWACEPKNRHLLESATKWLLHHQGSPGWSFVWRALLEHPDVLPEGTSLLQLGTQWLNGREDKDQWSFVWQDLLQHPTELPEGTTLNSLLQLGTQWLNGREDKDQWAFVWQDILQHSTELPEGTTLNSLLQLGTQWLNGREDKDQWSFIWETLFTKLKLLTITEEEFLNYGINWLRKFPDREDWNFVWKDILAYTQLFDIDLVRLGSEWLLTHDNHDQWAFVWQVLLQHPDALPEGTTLNSLLQLGIQWLNGREDKDQWAFVWRVLLEHPDVLSKGTTLDPLLQLGIQWLNGREDKDQWAFVWRALLDHPNALPEGTPLTSLLQLGIQWLNGREDKDQWSFVWCALLQHPDALPEGTSLNSLLKLGLQWLNGREDKDQWAFVWHALLEHPDSLPEGTFLNSLLQLGLQWLNGHEDKDQWSFVWETLFTKLKLLTITEEEFLNYGISWLRKFPDRKDWNFVWKDILAYTQLFDIDLVRLGSEWLLARGNHDQWSFVWRALLEHPDALPEGTSLDSLLQLGLQWLNGREDEDQWSFVWRALLQHPDALPEGTSLNSLLQLGTQWLPGKEDKDQWAFVWQGLIEQLIKQNKRRETIVNIENGKIWLGEHKGHKSWSNIFEVCVKNGDIDQGLLDDGIDWIIRNQEKPETAGIVFLVANTGEINKNKAHKQILIDWLTNWLIRNPNHPSWTFGWVSYKKLTTKLEALEIALTWIEENLPDNKKIKWVISILAETDDTDVINKIFEWHTNHKQHEKAGIILNTVLKVIGRTN
jgi:uncharacterized membrane protein